MTEANPTQHEATKNIASPPEPMTMGRFLRWLIGSVPYPGRGAVMFERIGRSSTMPDVILTAGTATLTSAQGFTIAKSPITGTNAVINTIDGIPYHFHRACSWWAKYGNQL